MHGVLNMDRDTIDQFIACPECFKTANYPAEWIADMTQRKRAVFEQYTDVGERRLHVNVIHDEYSQRFDAEIGVIKIPFEGGLYTLEEAQAMVAEEDHTEPSMTPEEFRLYRKRQGMKIHIRQAREWLIRHGITPAHVESIIATIPDSTERMLVLNYWEYSTHFHRLHPSLVALATALGMDDAQLDVAFEEAVEL